MKQTEDITTKSTMDTANLGSPGCRSVDLEGLSSWVLTVDEDVLGAINATISSFNDNQSISGTARSAIVLRFSVNHALDEN